MTSQWRVTLAAALLLLCAGCGSDPAASKPQPVRIALDGDGQLLVSDYRAKEVQFVDRQTLEVTRRLSVRGAPLAVGSYRNKIFVGNESRQCVEVYDRASGDKLYNLAGGPGSIPLPNDLAIDATAGRVFVTDTSGGRIKVFSPDGPLLYAITDPQLVQPAAVALDANGEHLYVADLNKNMVLVFSAAGAFERSISEEFFHPKGLAIDLTGHLYVVDTLHEQILVVDTVTGLEVTRLGIQSPYAGPHKMLFDAVFDVANQQVLVTDYLLGEIKAFTMREGNL